MTTASEGFRHPGLTPGAPESVRFSAGAGGLELLAVLNPCHREDVQAWRRGRLRVGLVPAGLHTFFLLYEVDGFGPWSDAPFSLGLLASERRVLPKRLPHQGRLLQVSIVEGQTALVCGVRAVSVSPTFSAVLEGLVEQQRAALDSWSTAGHDDEIQAAYRRWPSPDDMVPAAVALEVAGHKGAFR